MITAHLKFCNCYCFKFSYIIRTPIGKSVYVCVCMHAQSCLTLWDPMDYIAHQGSSVHGISQARILEWVAISYSNRKLSRRWLFTAALLLFHLKFYWFSQVFTFAWSITSWSTNFMSSNHIQLVYTIVSQTY